jgi:hypothetical protein
MSPRRTEVPEIDEKMLEKSREPYEHSPAAMIAARPRGKE